MLKKNISLYIIQIPGHPQTNAWAVADNLLENQHNDDFIKNIYNVKALILPSPPAPFNVLLFHIPLPSFAQLLTSILPPPLLPQYNIPSPLHPQWGCTWVEPLCASILTNHHIIFRHFQLKGRRFALRPVSQLLSPSPPHTSSTFYYGYLGRHNVGTMNISINTRQRTM